jgi:hypothetical protein
MKYILAALVFALGAVTLQAEVRGGGRVTLVKTNGDWQLLVDKETYLIKGMEYSVDVVGRAAHESNLWMKDDFNGNGRCDGPYDSWVDANRNNIQDKKERAVGDFKLLKDMGCNTIRIYHPANIDTNLLRDLHDNYGISVIMGNFLGAYTLGSKAEWRKGTDYTNMGQLNNMTNDVREMVLKYKDEDFVLMWMLGNENDMSGSYENSTYNNTNARLKPEAYAKFLNKIARMIKELDPDHPVGVCVGSYKLLPYFEKYAPELDIVGINSYAGPYGFGSLWNRVKTEFDRPVLITEFGCDSWDQSKKIEDEGFQARYHRGEWKDIIANSCFGRGAGNAIGGVVFCWLDKWWLSGSLKEHDTTLGAWAGPTQDAHFNDEWDGICGQGDGSKSPFLRHLKKAYYAYKNELWNVSYEELEKARNSRHEENSK